MGSRIGDIMALGAADVVFGDPAEVTIPSGLRSHGSLYEVMVPVIVCGGDFGGFVRVQGEQGPGTLCFRAGLALIPGLIENHV